MVGEGGGTGGRRGLGPGNIMGNWQGGHAVGVKCWGGRDRWHRGSALGGGRCGKQVMG